MKKQNKLSLPDTLTQGHQFDGGPFALDLYRLLGMVLSDKRMASLGDEATHCMPPAWRLQERFRKAELLRILISSAVALRILFDQKRDPRDQHFKNLSKETCGVLWPNAARRQREPLPVREACNKIIHATNVVEDEVPFDWRTNPDQRGLHVRPFVYLHGTKDGVDWRAKLSLVEFALAGANIFLRYMPE